MFVFGPDLPRILIKYKLNLDFRCPVCTIYFANSSALEKHNAVHADVELEPGELPPSLSMSGYDVFSPDVIFDMDYLFPEDQYKYKDQDEFDEGGDLFKGNARLTAEFDKFINRLFEAKSKVVQKGGARKIKALTNAGNPSNKQKNKMMMTAALFAKKKKQLKLDAQKKKLLMKPIRFSVKKPRPSTYLKIAPPPKLSLPPPTSTSVPVKLTKRQQSLMDKKLQEGKYNSDTMPSLTPIDLSSFELS